MLGVGQDASVNDYAICCVGGMYAGKWLVIRRSDHRLVFESRSIYVCVDWVLTHGATRGRSKRGREVSGRFLAMTSLG